MKKLIIVLAAVVGATAVNAAAFFWSTTGTIYKPTDSTAAVAGFTAYIFDTSTVSQTALVSALREGGAITDYVALSSYNTASAARVETTSFTNSGDVNAFFAIVQDDYVYISKLVSGEAQKVGTTPLCFASQSASSRSVFDAATAYSSAGWYGTAAVPEPTSGILVLLGMAGLALRRRA